VNLTQALRDARARTDILLNLVCPHALYERPIAERHRIVFYLGHLEAFDWNLLHEVVNLPSFHPSFDRLFAFGIDPGPGNLPADAPSDWPQLDEVHGYNARVRDELDARLADAPEQLLHVAIEHRLMHAETFAYMLHNLPAEHKVAQAQSPAGGGPVAPEMIEVPRGTARLGLDTGSASFGWDNEFEAHSVDVPAFAAGRYKVTNGEYLRFVEAGAATPNFWVRSDGQWYWRGMFEQVPLPLDWPVYVSQQEAQAYAGFAGKRLLTEAEYHRCLATAPPADPSHDNFDFYRWDPMPVNSGNGGSAGFRQLVGNGWEWTSTPFAPFPGFAAFPFYPGYSADFFDGQHYVMKGASARTAACFTRPSFRNWFRASYPYVYAGFRVAEE